MRKLFRLFVLAWLASQSAEAETRVYQSDLYLQTSSVSLEDQRDLGFKPRTDLPPWPLAFPIDWGADPPRYLSKIGSSIPQEWS